MKILNIKRYVYINIDVVIKILNSVAIAILFLFTLFIIAPLLLSVMNWGQNLPILRAIISRTNIQDNLIWTIALTISSTIVLFFKSYFVRIVKKWACPINLTVNNELKGNYLNYLREVKKFIKSRLPDDIKKKWNEDEKDNYSKLNTALIPLKAEERITTKKYIREYARAAYPINDLFAYLDEKLLLVPKSFVSPVMIEGEPGAGKSTFIFELFRQLSNRYQTQGFGWMPIIMFAQDFSPDMVLNANDFSELIVQYFIGQSKHRQNIVYSNMSNFISDCFDSNGGILVIIDGLDEITVASEYQKMAKKINSLIKKEENKKRFGYGNRFIVTCRIDDNQGLIKGRLIRLKSLDLSTIIKFMRKQVKYYPDDERIKIVNTIKTLHLMYKQGLLRTYIENPFLFTLVKERLYECIDPPPKKLRDVFEDVLRNILIRELKKPRVPYEDDNSIMERKELVLYISSFLSPLCYGLTFNKYTEIEYDIRYIKEMFKSYLLADKDMFNSVFGNNGYIAAMQKHEYLKSQKIYAEIKEHYFGDSKAEEFADVTFRVVNNIEYGIQKDVIVNWLFDDVMKIIDDCGLAIFRADGTLERFRHNRMREFFASLYIDRTILNKTIGETGLLLDNGWFKEQFRICAAITEYPVVLLNHFEDKYNKLLNDVKQDGSLYVKKMSLLANASEAIAYLPTSRKKNKKVYMVVSKIGRIVSSIVLKALEKDVTTENEPTGIIHLDRSLEILGRVYSSEFIRVTARNNSDEIKKSMVEHKEFECWNNIYSKLLLKNGTIKSISYQYLYKVAESNGRLYINHVKLFFLVFVNVICFKRFYSNLIDENRSGFIKKIIPWTLYHIENILAYLSSLTLLILLCYRVYSIADLPFAIVYSICIFLLIVIISLIMENVFKLIRTKEILHLPTWIFLLLLEKILLVMRCVSLFLVRLTKVIIADIIFAGTQMCSLLRLMLLKSINLIKGMFGWIIKIVINAPDHLLSLKETFFNIFLKLKNIKFKRKEKISFDDFIEETYIEAHDQIVLNSDRSESIIDDDDNEDNTMWNDEVLDEKKHSMSITEMIIATFNFINNTFKNVISYFMLNPLRTIKIGTILSLVLITTLLTPHLILVVKKINENVTIMNLENNTTKLLDSYTKCHNDILESLQKIPTEFDGLLILKKVNENLLSLVGSNVDKYNLINKKKAMLHIDLLKNEKVKNIENLLDSIQKILKSDKNNLEEKKYEITFIIQKLDYINSYYEKISKLYNFVKNSKNEKLKISEYDMLIRLWRELRSDKNSIVNEINELVYKQLSKNLVNTLMSYSSSIVKYNEILIENSQKLELMSFLRDSLQTAQMLIENRKMKNENYLQHVLNVINECNKLSGLVRALPAVKDLESVIVKAEKVDISAGQLEYSLFGYLWLLKTIQIANITKKLDGYIIKKDSTVTFKNLLVNNLNEIEDLENRLEWNNVDSLVKIRLISSKNKLSNYLEKTNRIITINDKMNLKILVKNLNEKREEIYPLMMKQLILCDGIIFLNNKNMFFKWLIPLYSFTNKEPFNVYKEKDPISKRPEANS